MFKFCSSFALENRKFVLSFTVIPAFTFYVPIYETIIEYAVDVINDSISIKSRKKNLIKTISQFTYGIVNSTDKQYA